VQLLALPALLHDFDATTWIEGTHKDESIAFTAFHEEVEQPIHAVVEIHVG